MIRNDEARKETVFKEGVIGFQASSDQSDDDPLNSDDKSSDIDTNNSAADSTDEDMELNSRFDGAKINSCRFPTHTDDEASESDVDSVIAPDFEVISDTDGFSC